MPHCIIEYSAGVSAQIPAEKLLEAVFKGTASSQLFQFEDIKVRAICYQSAICGLPATDDPSPKNSLDCGYVEKDFIHIVLNLLSGRTVEQRCELSKLVLNQLLSLTLADLSISVETCEIERQSYSKMVS
jgi:5-carboxymethyl-2-hydroxymuconate isomerase